MFLREGRGGHAGGGQLEEASGTAPFHASIA